MPQKHKVKCLKTQNSFGMLNIIAIFADNYERFQIFGQDSRQNA